MLGTKRRIGAIESSPPPNSSVNVKRHVLSSAEFVWLRGSHKDPEIHLSGLTCSYGQRIVFAEDELWR